MRNENGFVAHHPSLVLGIRTYKTLEEATAVAEAAHRKQWELAEKHELTKREAPPPNIDLDELGL